MFCCACSIRYTATLAGLAVHRNFLRFNASFSTKQLAGYEVRIVQSGNISEQETNETEEVHWLWFQFPNLNWVQ
jgi:hypothetical protein